ncbi:hypothetical protein [Klebsiella phage pKP-BM327-1.1]|nr:hypothetical protein [Klebsiella phage pKP-BM327-1.1]
MPNKLPYSLMGARPKLNVGQVVRKSSMMNQLVKLPLIDQVFTISQLKLAIWFIPMPIVLSAKSNFLNLVSCKPGL